MPTIVENGQIKTLSVEEFNKRTEKAKNYNLDLNSDGTMNGIIVGDLGSINVNGEKFNVAEITTLNTKTYVEEPGRSNNGAMTDINEYDTFIVPRCKASFSFMTIKDYQRLCSAIMSNEFVVEYFDKQFGQNVSHFMYCEPEEASKLYSLGDKAIGVLDYTISFIGTLNDLDSFKVRYVAGEGTIKNFLGDYASSKVYRRGDRVLYSEKYYEASFFIDSFKGVNPPNFSYWQMIPVSIWDDSKSYEKGDIVESKNEQNDNVTYYVAVFDGRFSGKPLSDKTYWNATAIGEYSNKTVYKLGDLVKHINLIYRAKYYKDDFSGILPINNAYWFEIPELNGETYGWGKSVYIEPSDNLFVAPTGKKFAYYTDDNGLKYYPKQNLNIIYDTTLKAIWENDL